MIGYVERVCEKGTLKGCIERNVLRGCGDRLYKRMLLKRYAERVYGEDTLRKDHRSKNKIQCVYEMKGYYNKGMTIPRGIIDMDIEDDDGLEEVVFERWW